jgi:hypothetical protein
VTSTRFAELPGHEHVERGVADLANGVETAEALLVTIAAPRLTELGVLARDIVFVERDAELRLYALLGREGDGDPYSRYNALLRELSSFIHALERRPAQALPGGPITDSA